jgi:PAS domain S-box-containing protein
VSTAALATMGRAAEFGAALSEQARMLRTLIGNLDGLVYRCRDDACWTMEFVSDGCERLTGYPAADLLHNHRISYGQIVHPDDLALLAQVAEASARTRERYTIEYRIVRADGAVRWVWERGTPVFGPDATLVAFEGFVEDD